jgi:ubiquinone/menaquinone biosynthesis C-methylase UbiE
MSFQDIYYPESRWGGFTRVDGTIAFYTRVNSLITPSSIVLDVGCGRGSYWNDPVRVRRNLRVLKDKCHKVIGLDVDQNASRNPAIHEFYLLSGKTWPVENASVNLCLADSVLEHIEDREAFFAECRRVLHPGGYLCLRTPNIFSYFGLASRLVPDRWRQKAVVKVQDNREFQDIFPTLYQCNTNWKISQMMIKHGFESYVYGHEAEPTYLSFSRFFYFLGVMHQRFAPNILKITLFAFGRKK